MRSAWLSIYSKLACRWPVGPESRRRVRFQRRSIAWIQFSHRVAYQQQQTLVASSTYCRKSVYHWCIALADYTATGCHYRVPNNSAQELTTDRFPGQHRSHQITPLPRYSALPVSSRLSHRPPALRRDVGDHGCPGLLVILLGERSGTGPLHTRPPALICRQKDHRLWFRIRSGRHRSRQGGGKGSLRL